MLFYLTIHRPNCKKKNHTSDKLQPCLWNDFHHETGGALTIWVFKKIRPLIALI